jgi:hypothetical protein
MWRNKRLPLRVLSPTGNLILALILFHIGYEQYRSVHPSEPLPMVERAGYVDYAFNIPACRGIISFSRHKRSWDRLRLLKTPSELVVRGRERQIVL